MKRLTFGLAAVMAGLVIAPNLASALSAVTTQSTDLRAGPAFDFPVVDNIPSEVAVNIHGCVRGYRWCDVSWRDARGWVPGDELAYLQQGRRVSIIEYGPRIGLPVVGYAFDTYWDRYYRGRPFYGERARWRSVWLDRERGEGRSSDRVRDRREGRIENRTDRRQLERTDRVREGTQRETERRQGEANERRSNREERSNFRTGRGDGRERGEARGYNPQVNATPRHEERSNGRAGRGDVRERGEVRGYNPQVNAGPRQEMNRGSRQESNPGGGRAESGARAPRGHEGGGGREDRKAH